MKVLQQVDIVAVQVEAWEQLKISSSFNSTIVFKHELV